MKQDYRPFAYIALGTVISTGMYIAGPSYLRAGEISPIPATYANIASGNGNGATATGVSIAPGSSNTVEAATITGDAAIVTPIMMVTKFGGTPAAPGAGKCAVYAVQGAGSTGSVGILCGTSTTMTVLGTAIGTGF